jgi:hypothetical protein
MRISKAILDQTASTAANLQTMIDETTNRYREVPGLSGLLGLRAYATWAMYGLFLSLIGLQNPRSAIVILLICVCMKTLLPSPVSGRS